MEIELKHFKLGDISNGYIDNDEEGCFAFDGKLNIRPKYQREFVYGDEKRNEVIKTIQKKFPLNVMYWVKNGDKYEILDGQQRTISFCQYIHAEFSLNDITFDNLTFDKKEEILNYKLNIYICEGSESEKLDWFKIINIAGVKLTDQELRNAVYTGEWLVDAKRHFSKKNCAAYNISNNYINGKTIRQEYLEIALKWISNNNKIETYMSKHQNDSNCNELWLYFQNVINWVKVLFPNFRKEMKGLSWGTFHNEYKDIKFDSRYLEEEIKKLMKDTDVTNKKGVYEYLLSNKKLENKLSIKAFDDKEKREAFEKQEGICNHCEEKFSFENMEGDHIVPWSKYGKTIGDNCQMLCKRCNGLKSNN